MISSFYAILIIVTKKYHCFQLYFTLSLFSSDVMSMSKTVVSDLLSAFPGIDEAMSFAEVMKYDFVSYIYNLDM